MSKKIWLIVGGLVFLWLSPFFFILGQGAWKAYWKADFDRRGEAWAKRMKENIKYDAVTDEDRRKWKEQAERERIEAEAERERRRNAYLASPINVPKPTLGYWRPQPDEEDEYGNPIQYRTRVVYMERDVPLYQRRQEQPDLTGFYWKRDDEEISARLDDFVGAIEPRRGQTIKTGSTAFREDGDMVIVTGSTIHTSRGMWVDTGGVILGPQGQSMLRVGDMIYENGIIKSQQIGGRGGDYYLRRGYSLNQSSQTLTDFDSP